MLQIVTNKCLGLIELLNKYCPDLDYEMAAVDITLTRTKSQIPGKRITVKNLGRVASMDKVRMAIICCSCIADTDLDIVSPSHPDKCLCRDLITLKRKLWFEHDPVRRTIVNASLKSDFQKECGYDIPVTWNPDVVSRGTVAELLISWGKPHFENCGPREAYTYRPETLGSINEGRENRLEPVVPVGMDILDQQLDHLRNIFR